MQPNTAHQEINTIPTAPAIEKNENSDFTQEEIAHVESVIGTGKQHVEHFGGIGVDVAAFIQKFAAEERDTNRDEKWLANVAGYVDDVITSVSGMDEHFGETGVSSPLIDYAKNQIKTASQKTDELLRSSVMATIDLERYVHTHPGTPVSIDQIKPIIPQGQFGAAPISLIGALAKSFVSAQSKAKVAQ